MNIDNALEVVLQHEGGYVNHPNDPGGETMYGITRRVARENGYTGNMRDIPMSLVTDIYTKQYWNKIRADELPPELRLHVFDAAVNSGVSRAVKWLQQAGGVTQDGIIGPNTLRAAKKVTPAQYSAIRLRFLAALSTFPTFGRGWVRRIATNLEHVDGSLAV